MTPAPTGIEARLSAARLVKQRQLEREIRESAATDREKANMLHSLSKIGIFAADEVEATLRSQSRALAEREERIKELASALWSIAGFDTTPDGDPAAFDDCDFEWCVRKARAAVGDTDPTRAFASQSATETKP